MFAISGRMFNAPVTTSRPVFAFLLFLSKPALSQNLVDTVDYIRRKSDKEPMKVGYTLDFNLI